VEPRSGSGWLPDPVTVAAANLTAAITERGLGNYDEFYAWSVSDRAAFWEDAMGRVGVVFDGDRGPVLDDGSGPGSAVWLPEARLNIAASCFNGDLAKTAVVFAADGEIRRVSRQQLRQRVLSVAGGLVRAGVAAGDRVAIAMPMTVDAVAAYLGIVWVGGVVVSIADSFVAEEIAERLRIAGASIVVTQDVVRRGGKLLPMYDKVKAAGATRAIVIDTGAGAKLRPKDLDWESFLDPRGAQEPVSAPADGFTNILFSSGTTGEPKAIPWTQTTPIKAAVDGHYHQDIHPTDVVAWPTNLGWMMGPWLIYASLMNGAALALHDDVPTGVGFGRFVRDAGVTVLGVVPSLVAAWRATACMEGIDWSGIRLFSSTGESSNQSDMAYLMDLGGNKPIIEYCGGTELGGGYISGTVVHEALPSTFTTPTLGMGIRILDEVGNDAAEGELFLVPPSIGMSTTLLNGDHNEVYFAGTPSPDGLVLRRHGDHMEQLDNGYYRALGRVDDAMNLGGIKVSSAQIERVVSAAPGVAEAAAIAVSPDGGGPSLLVVYAVSDGSAPSDTASLRTAMQIEIRSHLNPLFKIHEIVVPRTASAKVMRRSLRDSHRNGGRQ